MRVWGQQGTGRVVFAALITKLHWEHIKSVGEDLIEYSMGRVSAGVA